MKRALGATIVILLAVGVLAPRAAALPERLSDQAFWKLVTDASEPGGYFRGQDITNLTSNEMRYEDVIPDLVRRVKPGEVYLGVGPEQNFTYMTALRPTLAIIFDVRRGNLDLQLMYKALFELSSDRADFVSRLFAKPRPTGLAASATADELFAAFARQASSEPLFTQNLAAIEDRLVKVHGYALGSSHDLAGIEDVYRTFYESGFAVRAVPTYADLMTATDAQGVSRGYLSS